MATPDLKALLLRVVALQKTIPLTNSEGRQLTADAVPKFFWSQGSWPYFVNRIDGPTTEDDSEDFEKYEYTVVMRLVVDHLTSGADGERELDLYCFIPTIVEYFATRRQLRDDTYPAELDNLLSAEIRPGGTGMRLFRQSGLGAGVDQIGSEFSLVVRYEQLINQVFE